MVHSASLEESDCVSWGCSRHLSNPVPDRNKLSMMQCNIREIEPTVEPKLLCVIIIPVLCWSFNGINIDLMQFMTRCGQFPSCILGNKTEAANMLP